MSPNEVSIPPENKVYSKREVLEDKDILRDIIHISNIGEVDVAGIRLLGASTKRGEDGKIGYFGTGWKYAVACLLRNGIWFRVFSGEREVKITVRETVMRGVRFDEVLVDNIPTGFTTQTGPTWEPWMALREMICNAMDEGDMSLVEGWSGKVAGRSGFTSVFVYGKVEEKYFRLVEEEDEVRVNGGRILRKVDPNRTRVYRRGILVLESDEKSLYDYECDSLRVSEDRLARGWDVRESCWRLVDDAPVSVKRKVVLGGLEFERSLAASFHGNPSLDWALALENVIVATKEQHQFHGTGTVFADAWVSVLGRCPGVETLEKSLRGRTLSRGERQGGDRIAKVLVTLRRVGINISYKDVLVVDAFASPNVRGTWSAEEGKIRVLKSLDDTELLVTLVHEWAHRESGATDCTREFEEFAFQTVVRLIMNGGRLS